MPCHGSATSHGPRAEFAPDSQIEYSENEIQRIAGFCHERFKLNHVNGSDQWTLMRQISRVVLSWHLSALRWVRCPSQIYSLHLTFTFGLQSPDAELQKSAILN